MKKKIVIAALLLAAAAAGAAYWWQQRSPADPDTLVLNGNVDIRQVSLAFDGSGRIRELAVQEGDQVKAGQLLGRLDTDALRLQADAAKAQIDVQQHNLANQKSGARPQEIAQAKSRVAAAQAQAVQAKNELARLNAIAADTQGKATSKQELDSARSAAKVAAAQLAEQQQALKLLQAGTRREEIDATESQVKSAQAQLALLEYQIGQAELKAPVDGVVRSRLLEPGDMATPQTPVFAIALTQPKWIRAYVAEPDLGKIQPGMRASVSTDSAPNQPLEGSVGYIASVAEFTPKSVQTQELRTSLVYEIRVQVADKDNVLRLGQPATVRLNLGAAAKP